MNSIRWLLSMLGLILCLSSPAWTEISFSPKQLFVSLADPTLTTDIHFTVENSTATTETLSLVAVDLSPQQTVKVQNKRAISPASWVSFTPTDVTLAGATHQAITAKVAPGRDIPAGTYTVEINAIERTTKRILASVRMTIAIAAYVKLVPITPFIDMGNGDHGRFVATARFQIDANVDTVEVLADVSSLNTANDRLRAVIPMDDDRGIEIAPADAATEELDDTEHTGKEEHMKRILVRNFEAQYLSQEILVTVWWSADDSGTPAGAYNGQILLTARAIADEQ